MIRFASPEWFLVLPALLLLGWKFPALGLIRPLRLTLMTLLCLMLAGIEMRRFPNGLDLWVLVDRSASAADRMSENLREAETLIARARGADDRVHYVDFAESPVPRDQRSADAAPGKGLQTRLPLAVNHALSVRDPDRPARILVVSDGYSTEPYADLARRLQAEGVPLDYRLFSSTVAGDVKVARWHAESQVLPGEPFVLEAIIEGQSTNAVPIKVLKNGKVVHDGQVELERGRALFRTTDRLYEGGSVQYEVVVDASGDTIQGNNRAARWVEVRSGERILLVSAYAEDPLAAVIRAQGLSVQVVTDFRTLNAGSLAGARAVIFNNVPAHVIPADFLRQLDFYVRVQGRGFMMTGGRFSFGSGGYFESAVDKLLPVSMELRNEHRKLISAMAVVLDRSGSMAVGVEGGMLKMDLANAGAARVVELLGQRDWVSVLAVDSEPHVILPMAPIGDNREKLANIIRTIGSGGGGIFVYTGLAAGWKELQEADAGQRHLILFADAADAEEPGEYIALLEEMTVAGVTVSVIGLGTPEDIDAAFLEDVARLGKGRMFYTMDAAELPALFAQETVAIARSAFIETPSGLKAAPGWLELAARNLDWPAAVDGYNLSYLREDASAIAWSTDEYSAPLAAHWQRGAGRVAAVCFPLAGEFSASVRQWRGFGDFGQSLARWLAGDDLPEGLGLKTAMDGDEVTLDLFYDRGWEQKIQGLTPRIYFSADLDGQVTEAPWRRQAPGHYQARIKAEQGVVLRGSIEVGSHRIPFGPVNIAHNLEWSFDPEQLANLRGVSAASGGRELINLSEAFAMPESIMVFSSPLRHLLLLFIALFLLEALMARTGWHPLGRWTAGRFTASPGKWNFKPRASPSEDATNSPVDPVTAVTKSPNIEEGPSQSDAEKRRERFWRAKGRLK